MNKALILLGLYLLLSALGMGASLIFGTTQFWQSYLVSNLLVSFSLATLSLSIALFFMKKNIALLTGLIVFKWPVLIYLTYRLAGSMDLNSLGFPAGLAPLMGAAVGWIFIEKA